MSGGRRGKAGGGTFIILIILAIALKDLWAPLLSIAASLFAVGVGFLAVFGLITFMIVKLTKNKGYVEPQKDDRPSKNPYSVNYNKEKVDEAEKKRQEAKKAAKDKNSEIVIDGKTVKESPVEEVKKETVAPKAEKKHVTTGDPEIDKMIVDKDLAIEEMKRLDEAIEDEKLSEQIVHMQQVTEKIVDYIIAHPKKKKQVGKFFSYYLPTTLKILNAYDRMDSAGVSGENIDGTKGKIENMMETAVKAYDVQLDALFADEALDVSTDIKVLENMLKSEGLTDDSITLKVKKEGE